MSARDEYNRCWAEYPATHPERWTRESHHGTPNPEFVALCQEAEARRFTFGLSVSAKRYGPESSNAYRLLESLVVGAVSGPPTKIIKRASGEPLGAWARRARLALGPRA